MVISSQRPSELSKTVVSQCSNFIIHRVQNLDDLNYISKMVPYINRSILDRLTYLQTGHALVFGTAINLQTLTDLMRQIRILIVQMQKFLNIGILIK